MYDRPAMPLPEEAKKDSPRHKVGGLISKFKKLATHDKHSAPQQVLEQQVHQQETSASNVNVNVNVSSSGIFGTAISSDAPLSIFSRTTHPVPVPSKVNSNNLPIETNKFYGNMLLENQTNPVWTHPYSAWFSKDDGFQGLAMNQVPASARVFGPDASANPVQFYFSPTGIKSLVLGSTDFDSNVTLGLENMNHLSADCKIYSANQGYLLAPLVQGMGFVTGIYYNLIPQIKSAVGFKSCTGSTSPRSGINKYTILLENNVTWMLYVTIPQGQSLNLALRDGNTVVGDQSVNGAVFQLVASDNSSVFDAAAGCYPTRGTLSGSVSNSTGTYSINYNTAGTSNKGTTAMFALPHHVSSFTSDMASSKTEVTLATTSKGNATCYLTNAFNFSISVPSNISFDPYSAISGKSSPSWSDDVKSKITAAATTEVTGDVINESNIDSMYSSGKILAKYAWILYVTHFVLKNDNLTNKLLPNVKTAIQRFSKNTQSYPLSYDQTWKGIVSTADSSADFGNSYYNDHHFHYGYHIMAAAVTCAVDKDLGGNFVNEIKNWINDLCRDIATPDDGDQYFPAFRSFDWYNGHSWAKGLYPSGDGKDEESSSEDYNAYYAMKLWASVINDSAMEHRALLQLGIMNGSLNDYFLMANNNTVQPPNFIGNKVTGILFENKVDHTTYFGMNLEYIQMIHAIPITSFSSFIRSPTFCQEEWNEKLKAIVNDVNDGWKGIIMLNVALFDPSTSYKFFSDSSFSNSYLDNGQSLTWSLCYSGAFA
ncbi:CYFA0S22e00298g1_1 [Cyberlindnera fabianii]|uniref:glucan endo-1,3-beta-D-glucosidase n=1 Tax=Cyberlindnera fabianii TaxID=36022 RepID=A0A061B878_CYBFA|nr:CYFA0S22e00298g1_1 [Cyberlindnera fabianii]